MYKNIRERNYPTERLNSHSLNFILQTKVNYYVLITTNIPTARVENTTGENISTTESIFNAIWCLLAIIRQSKRFCGVMVHFIVLYAALFSNIIAGLLPVGAESTVGLHDGG